MPKKAAIADPSKVEPARRRPRQARALATRELIFDAAARVLDEHGLEGFNTNRIAEVSGFGVGTLFQYFDDKEAILRGLGERELARAVERMRGAIARSGESGAARVRHVVHTLLNVFDGRHRARKVLVQYALAHGAGEVVDRPVHALAALISSGTLLKEARVPLVLTPTDAFVLTQAVTGAVRAALMRDPGMLRRRAFEEALVRLIIGFLAPR